MKKNMFHNSIPEMCTPAWEIAVNDSRLSDMGKGMLIDLLACENSGMNPAFGQCVQRDGGIRTRVPGVPSATDVAVLSKTHLLKCFTGPRATECFFQEKDRGHAYPWPLSFDGIFLA